MFAPHSRALVTGAASGIGRAIAGRLAAEGVGVVCADIDLTGAEAAASALRDRGGSAVALRVDISEETSLAALPDLVGALELAGTGLDIVVNNAAISDVTPTNRLDLTTFRRVIEVNLLGAAGVTLALLPLLRASANARVLNIASIQGLVATRDSLAYATAKGGLITFTRALAADLADDGVLVNALAPGFVDTPMAILADGSSEYSTDEFRTVYVEHGRIPLRRPAGPAEVAEAALFFCSASNTYVTGQILAVDGGLTATF